MQSALLFRPRPHADELFSSWLVRLAWANTQKLHSFTRKVLPRRLHWLRDLDSSCSGEDIADICEASLLPYEKIFVTTLRQYETRVFETLNVTGPTRWLMPVGKRGRNRLLHGQQYCRHCLLDGESYFKRRWRLAFSVVCAEHEVVLRDACGDCGATIAFHHYDFGRNSIPQECPITICWACRTDLRTATKVPDYPASPDAVALQRALDVCLDQGWSDQLPGARAYGLLFFEGLHKIARLASSPGRGARLRRHFQQQDGVLSLNFGFPNRRNRVEDLRVGDRLIVMSIVRRLIEGWPSSFIEACRASRVTSWYIADVGRLPHWLDAPVRLHLGDRFYAPTATERAAVKKYLLEAGESASENQIRRWLGVRFNSRHPSDPFLRPAGHWNSRRSGDRDSLDEG